VLALGGEPDRRAVDPGRDRAVAPAPGLDVLDRARPLGRRHAGVVAQLYVDGHLAGEIDMPFATPVAFNPGGMCFGANPGSAVTPDYRAPFRFTGTLYGVTVDLPGDLIVDAPSEMRMHMARQ
jgi:hypothetical protein